MRFLAVLALSAVMLCVSTAAMALPKQFAQQGYLVGNDGSPFDGELDVRIRLYSRKEGGVSLFEEEHRNVTFTNGFYSVMVGSVEPLDTSTFAREER